MDVATLADLLREAEEHHADYEKTAPEHHWSRFYAAYINAREQGRTPEEASKQRRLRTWHKKSIDLAMLNLRPSQATYEEDIRTGLNCNRGSSLFCKRRYYSHPLTKSTGPGRRRVYLELFY